MTDTIEKIETFFVSIPNSDSYMSSHFVNSEMKAKGYAISPINKTIYPSDFRSILVKVTTKDGCVGWGETYGLCAPKAIAEIHKDVMAPYLTGRDPLSAPLLWDEVYDLMRVRGYTGYYCDALAGIDIALWDIAGKILDKPLSALLGGQQRSHIGAYVSGIKGPSISDKISAAESWIDKGFNALKLHLVHSDDIISDFAGLRKYLGDHPKLMVDLHWNYSASRALQISEQLYPLDPEFIEAPVKPEDLIGFISLSEHSRVALAAGEQWRTAYDAIPYLSLAKLRILQPEMGHTGVSQFMKIAEAARAFNAQIIPHSTIGSGIFLAASLCASSAIPNVKSHEFHPAITAQTETLLSHPIVCERGRFTVPGGVGIGVTPTQKLLDHAQLI